jgi:hypothetical protein
MARSLTTAKKKCRRNESRPESKRAAESPNRRRIRLRLPKGWHVKYSKVAAAMAGSVIAVGVGAPAFAADAAPAMPTSINAGVDQLFAAQPVQQMLDGAHVTSAASTVDRTADSLPANALLGQATGLAKSGALSTVTGALPASSLLGGLPMNGLPIGG